MTVSVGKVFKWSVVGVGVLVTVFIAFGYGHVTGPLIGTALNRAFATDRDTVRFDIHGYIYEVPRVYLWSRSDMKGGKKGGFNGHAYLRIDDEGNARVEAFSKRTLREQYNIPGKPNTVTFLVVFYEDLKSHEYYLNILDKTIKEIEINKNIENWKYEQKFLHVGEDTIYDYFLIKIDNFPYYLMSCKKRRNKDMIRQSCKVEFVPREGIEYRIIFTKRHLDHFETIVRDTTALMDSFARPGSDPDRSGQGAGGNGGSP